MVSDILVIVIYLFFILVDNNNMAPKQNTTVILGPSTAASTSIWSQLNTITGLLKASETFLPLYKTVPHAGQRTYCYDWQWTSAKGYFC